MGVVSPFITIGDCMDVIRSCATRWEHRLHVYNEFNVAIIFTMNSLRGARRCVRLHASTFASNAVNMIKSRALLK